MPDQDIDEEDLKYLFPKNEFSVDAASGQPQMHLRCSNRALSLPILDDFEKTSYSSTSNADVVQFLSRIPEHERVCGECRDRGGRLSCTPAPDRPECIACITAQRPCSLVDLVLMEVLATRHALTDSEVSEAYAPFSRRPMAPSKHPKPLSMHWCLLRRITKSVAARCSYVASRPDGEASSSSTLPLVLGSSLPLTPRRRHNDKAPTRSKANGRNRATKPLSTPYSGRPSAKNNPSRGRDAGPHSPVHQRQSNPPATPRTPRILPSAPVAGQDPPTTKERLECRDLALKCWKERALAAEARLTVCQDKLSATLCHTGRSEVERETESRRWSLLRGLGSIWAA